MSEVGENRPKRAKTGGRQKGTPNKTNAERQAQVASSGLTPLDYMLSVLRDESADATQRAWAAKEAAPYVHNKLAAVTHTGTSGGPIQVNITSDFAGLL
jgi:hypothetical protein